MGNEAEPRPGHHAHVEPYASGTMPAGTVIEGAHVEGEGSHARLITDTRLRAALSVLPAIVFGTDAAGIITLASGGGLAGLGLAPADLEGHAATTLFGSNGFVERRGETTTCTAAIRRALAGESVRGLAYVGDVVLDTRFVPLHGPETGGISGISCVAVDVTERARAEEARRDDEARLAATLDSIGEAVIATDDAGSIRHMNPVAERLVGWSAHEAVGRPIEEVVRLEGNAGGALDASRRAPAADSAPASMNVGLLPRSGSPRRVAITWAPIRDRGGIVLTLRDTTDEHAALQALERSEASFRALIEGSPEMILVHREGRIVYVNHAVLDKLGYASRDELLGGGVDDLVPEADRAALETKAAHTVHFRRKDGELLSAENVAIRGVFDGEQAVVLIGRDVTERDEIHQQLLRTDRMAALGTLSAGVAHEINNPLTYVLVNVDHVIRRLRSLVAAQEEVFGGAELTPLIDALTQAMEGAARVRQIVRDLMTFSRGHVDQKGIVDVRRVLEASLQMAAHELRHRARVEKRLREVAPVEVNEARLGQVFLNLLVNAAHAIPEGDASNNVVSVSTSMADDDQVVIEISDTGGGIPAEHLSRIFDPFFTTRPTGSGSGLGLAVAHGIIKSFGGDLKVTSTVGKGTTFRIVLPHAPGYEDTGRRSALLSPTPPVRRKVLVIDDDPRVGDAIALSLRDEHDVTVMTSGRDALEKLAGGERYDVVLCDLMMPEMTGMDFYREVLRVAPQLVGRLVFMSGGAFTPRARAFVEGLPNRCIEKPPDVHKLRELVRRRGG